MESSADKVKTAMRPAIRLIRGYQRVLGYDTIVVSISLVTSYQQYRCQLIDPVTRPRDSTRCSVCYRLQGTLYRHNGVQGSTERNIYELFKHRDTADLSRFVNQLVRFIPILVRKYISRKTILTQQLNTTILLNNRSTMCLNINKNLTYGDFKLALLSPKFSISNFLKLCITVVTL